ncbi:hypothetical protein RSK20926_19537 [Roseobacter sp. SK209-2-6]|uniref:glycosyltransferase family 1 protein n=1 Tax=Roseobacter sp. SK209-2-6 TaxID=388739 RepID=UPI0000F3F603|nr:glycosyltransferase family 1 protein [Roseobacter sp. SK209-2-6]EBA17964.1 hypothetical protein RSK20926_19537 [Roseobacter sp. SK209-2-6]
MEELSQCEKELNALSDFLRAETLAAASLKQALVLGRLYGRLHWDNISGFFSDDSLEAELFKRWQDELTRKPVRKNSPHRGWVHVLTRVYPAGGHTRLFRTLAAGLAKSGIPQTALLTQRSPKEAMAKLPPELTQTEVLAGSASRRAQQIYSRCCQAEVVLLHNHPDDLGAALAARALQEEGVRVLFVNHADHVFSYGPGACDAVLEICATGWKTTAQRRKAKAQQFMGIPVVPREHSVPEKAGSRDGPILSIGGGGKFLPNGDLSFPRFLEKLLPKISNDVVLIGPSAKEDWWKPVQEKFPDRLHLMGVQPFEVLKEQFEHASCYVDSFPLDGGTAFPEAVMAGLPAFALNKDAAPGVSPTDALRQATMEEVVESISKFLNGGEYPNDLKSVRQRILHDFSYEAVTERVLEAAKGRISDPPEYIMKLGNRSSDYNAWRWKAEGHCHIPKRIWRQLSPVCRVRLYQAISDLPLTQASMQTLKKRVLLG